MSKIVNIVKSRFIKGENLPEWYEKRLSVCAICPLNSVNISRENKSTTRKGWELIAGQHCTDPTCGCSITEKAKIESEKCPQNHWGSEYINDGNKTLLLTTEDPMVNFKYNKDKRQYELVYKMSHYNFNSNVDVFIEKDDIVFDEIKSSCGCTTPSLIKTDDGNKIRIKYDTKRVGPFEKNVIMTYTIDGSQYTTIIKLSGNVNPE